MVLLTAPEEAILADLAKVYVACPGTPFCMTRCMVCGRPLRSEPAVIYLLITLDPCPDDKRHLIAGAAARHAGCDLADDGEIHQAVVDAVMHDCAG